MDSWRSSIECVQKRRKQEIVNGSECRSRPNNKVRAVEEKDILALAGCVAELSGALKAVRSALWTALNKTIHYKQDNIQDNEFASHTVDMWNEESN